MATYYARNVTGNWSANTSWDSASSGGDGPAGPPVAGDTAIFDAGFTGTITLSASAACTVLTCAAGATGTLAFGAATLTVAGNVTLDAGMTYTATSGTLSISADATFTTNAATFPANVVFLSGNKTVDANGTTLASLSVSISSTITLASALQVTTFRITATTVTFAGAFDITCTTFNYNPPGQAVSSLALVNGQTITVATNLSLVGGYAGATVKSSTASSDTFLHFNGAASACNVCGITFTDVNCAHAIDNWYGGTLTRTTGITNRTSADIGGGSGGVFVTTQNGIGV